MPTNPIQSVIDSGLQFTEMQRKEAEKLVKKLVKAGEVRSAEADKTVQSLIERGKQTSAQIAELIKSEITKQFGWLADRVDEVEDQLESLVSRVSGRGGEAPKPAASAPAKKAPAARKTAVRKAPAKKATAKKAPAKKATAKKAHRQEGDRQEGDRQEDDRGPQGFRLQLTPARRWPPGGASTPNSFAGASRRHAARPRR